MDVERCTAPDVEGPPGKTPVGTLGSSHRIPPKPSFAKGPPTRVANASVQAGGAPEEASGAPLVQPRPEQRSPSLEAPAAPSVEAPAPTDTSLRQQLRDVLNEARANFADGREQDSGPDWKMSSWFRDSMAEVLATALVQPLEKEPEPGSMELAFVRALASKGSQQLVHDMLSKGNVVDALAKKLMELAKNLLGAKAATGSELNSKFAQDSDFDFVYGKTNEFFSGLEELIGSPDPHVMDAMEREHCSQADSKEEWETRNYGITTTPLTEWRFVVKPESLLASEKWPKETINTEYPRQAKPLHEFQQEFAAVNETLERKGEPEVIEPEWIGVRLYTGPMFEKFNAVLRGGLLTGENTVRQPTVADHFKERFQDLCHGNRYVTTIHVINSGLIKLSKLETATKLYRGMVGGRLPKCFWEGGEEKVRGGVERGFLSTSKKKEVAQQYTKDGKAQTVFEIQTGLIDRGADLSKFSQYPHEAEICFPPLTCLEVLQDRAEGSCLMLEMRLNVNLTSDTIERVITRRHRIVQNMCEQMHIETIQYLEAEFWKEVVQDEREVTCIQKAVGRLAKDKLAKIHQKPPDSFNNDMVLLSAVKDALAVSDSIKWMKSTVLLEAADHLQQHAEGSPEKLAARDHAIDKAKQLKEARGVRIVNLTNEQVRALDLTGGSSTRLIMEKLKLENMGGILHLQEEHKHLPKIGKGFELLQVNGKRGSVDKLTRSIVSSAGGARLEFLQQRDSNGLKEEVKKILQRNGTNSSEMEVGRMLAVNPDNHTLDLRGPFKATPEQEDQKLKPQAGQIVMKTMKTNVTLQSLLLCNNAIGAETAKMMGQCLQSNYTLRTLNMGDNQLGPDGGYGIRMLLEKTSTIDTLRVRENKLGPLGGKAVAEGLKKNTSLQILYIERNELGEEGGKAIAESLRENRTLQGLHIDGNQLGPEAGKAIARALADNKTLLTLWMEKNTMREEGGKAMADALSTNQTLKSLSLSENDIGQSASMAIASSMEKNHGLTTLEMEANKFGDEGAKAFAKMIQVNTSLQVLRIQMNGFGPEATKFIAEALKIPKGRHQGIQRLSVDGNPIELEGVDALAKAIECPTCSLQHLDLKKVNLGLEGVKKVAEALAKKETKLSVLTVQETKLGDEGGAALAKALEDNQSLHTLKMQDNNLGPETAKALANALEKNCKLIQLQLNGDFGEDKTAIIEAWNKKRSNGLEWQKAKK